MVFFCNPKLISSGRYAWEKKNVWEKIGYFFVAQNNFEERLIFSVFSGAIMALSVLATLAVAPC